MMIIMSQWLSVSIGILAGVFIIAGAGFFAVRPYLQARPPKPLWPDPADPAQDWGNWNGWNGPSPEG
jgi:hypothetical protein